jgi:predicted metal-dependent hydrolase
MSSIVYKVRESHKAKHVSLKLSVAGELEVVVPPGFDAQRIPAIVQKKQAWIERVTQKMAAHQASARIETELPQQVTFAAINQTWDVEYVAAQRLSIKLIEVTPGRLRLYGNVGDRQLCHTALQQWVINQGRKHLLPWLKRVSTQTGLGYSRSAVRLQKTLWGSCSTDNAISLNGKLMFLGPEVVRYIMVHELSHTIHHNHSPRFWQLVAQHEVNYEQLDHSLKDARFAIPRWLEKDA